MKRAVLALIISALIISGVFAEDQKAKTEKGRTVILHDDGSWEYAAYSSADTGCVGKWEMNEDALDSLIDRYLEESGIDSTSPTYSFYKNYMKELIMQQLKSAGLNAVITLTLNEDGSFVVEAGEESYSGSYYVNDSRELTVTVDDEQVTFGTFDEEYTILTIMNEEYFFLTKVQ